MADARAVLPWRETSEGVDLAVRLTPRGGRAGIDGIIIQSGQPCLKLRVPAPAVDGAANEALIEWLSRAVGVPRSDIAFLSGQRARVKRLRLRGDNLPDRLRALLGPH